MRPLPALYANRDAIRRVVVAHRAANARLFGSALRGEDTLIGDLDILVDPLPEMTLMDLAAIVEELTALLGVPVDVTTVGALPVQTRDAVLLEAQAI